MIPNRARKQTWLLAAVFVGLPTPAAGGEPVGPPPRIVRLPTAADTYPLALADLKALIASEQIAASDALFYRYLWVQDGRPEGAQLDNLTLNYISRARVPLRSPVVQELDKDKKPTGPMLVRVDLRRYAPIVDGSAGDLAEWITLWEQLQYDPSFSTLITKDTLDLLVKFGEIPEIVQVGKSKILVKSPPYVQDGQTYNERWVSVIRQRGRGLDDKVASELEALTGSLAPVVDDRYFTFRALSMVKDAGGDAKDNETYATIWGGQYYEWNGIKKSKDKKVTDLDLFFKQIGIGDASVGLTADKVFATTKSDQRTAMFRSKVTGKPRAIDFLPTLSTRFGEGQGYVLITHDPADKDVDITNHPMMFLKRSKDGKIPKSRALEVISSKPNGLQFFVLFTSAGELQDEAPFDVVNDDEIPRGFTKRLQGAISCIRCHGTDGSDGLKPLRNDVQLLKRRYEDSPDLDLFGDLTDLNQAIPETLDELAGQYAGSPDPGLVVARAAYIKGILRSSGLGPDDQWQGDPTGTKIGQLTAKEYEARFRSYWYDEVDAFQAMRELGYGVPPKQAEFFFRRLVPPDFPVGRKLRRGERVPEDIRIAAIGRGSPTGRVDFSLTFSFQAGRARKTEARMTELLKQAKEKK